MKKVIGIILSGILFLALAGCGLLYPSAETPTFIPTNTIAAFPTEPIATTEIPLPTMIPPTATPSPIATLSEVSMIRADVDMDNYSLRTGPGRLFERVDTYSTGAVVKLIGRESTNNWVLVSTDNNNSGWMNLVGLKPYGEIHSLPIFKVDNAQILRGHVYLPGKIAASGVGVSIAQKGETLSLSHDDSNTNAAGEWAIYLPVKTSGDWIIGPNSVVCSNTNAAKTTADGCEILGNLPPAREISLPLSNDLAIEFEILPLNP
jgi:hypothetical protein